MNFKEYKNWEQQNEASPKAVGLEGEPKKKGQKKKKKEEKLSVFSAGSAVGRGEL